MDSLPFDTALWTKQNSVWPQRGKVILASYTAETIVVYQAYNSSIAKHALEQQTFRGCDHFSFTRMTWIKPNFLWMMYRSAWASKHNQESILAIEIRREGFEEILRNAVGTQRDTCRSEPRQLTSIRLQWDPDHGPMGEPQARRAVQLGIKGKALDRFVDEWIVRMWDVTEFARVGGALAQKSKRSRKRSDLDALLVPKEQVYRFIDVSLQTRIYDV